MQTWAYQLHRDDQNRACLRGRGPVLPHCGICKSCPEFQTVVKINLRKRKITTHLGEDDDGWD